MSQAATVKSYRGVLCGYCRQPIPVPGIIEQFVANESDSSEKQGRTFNLRCRACEREKRYRLSDVIEIEGSPRQRSLQLNRAQFRRDFRLARAAHV